MKILTWGTLSCSEDRWQEKQNEMVLEFRIHQGELMRQVKFSFSKCVRLFASSLVFNNWQKSDILKQIVEFSRAHYAISPKNSAYSMAQLTSCVHLLGKQGVWANQ